MNHVVEKFKLCEVDDLAEFVDFPLNKILTTSDPEYLQAHYQEMEAPFKRYIKLYVYWTILF